MRTIIIEPLWKLRGEFQHLIQHPPAGYRFVIQQTKVEALAKELSRTNLAYYVHWTLQRLLPVNLFKPYWERFRKLSADMDLTYAVVHPVFRHEPWLLDMRLEQPYLLVGSEAVFERWKWLLKPALTSSYCRKIVFELEAGKQAFLQLTRWHELEPKMAVVHSGVQRRNFSKSYPERQGRIKLLFVNSANITVDEHFYTHGGRVLLEAFLQLQKRYDNLELLVRSNLPQSVRQQYQGVPNLRIIDQVIPWEALEAEFRSADIFLYPTHVTPSIAFLDSMSYELPIVTTDVWGNPELVQDGRTGILVHHPEACRYTDRFVVHFDSSAYKKAIASVNRELVENVVRGVSTLIENPELRRRLGREGRREVDEGRFSLQHRNASLKRALDEAVIPSTDLGQSRRGGLGHK